MLGTHVASIGPVLRSNMASQRGGRRSTPVAFLALVAMVAASSTAASPALAQSPAEPDPCSYADLNVQAKVVLSVPVRDVPATVSTNCLDWGSYDTWDEWAGMAKGAKQDGVLYATNTGGTEIWFADPIQVFDTNRLGTWTWTPVRALPPLTLAGLNSPTMDVRVGSVSYVAATRSGSHVTVSTRAYRYWTSTHAFGTWGLAQGIIQWRSPGTTTWKNLKNVSSDNYGTYSYRYTVTSQREYRVVMFDGTYVWGNTSANTARS